MIGWRVRFTAVLPKTTKKTPKKTKVFCKSDCDRLVSEIYCDPASDKKTNINPKGIL